MPWSASEAKGHTKEADTPKKKKAWAKIANSALKQYNGNEGKAVRVANAAVARMGNDEMVDSVVAEVILMMRDETRSRVVKKDPFGRVREVHERHEITSEDYPPRKHAKKKKKEDDEDEGKDDGKDGLSFDRRRRTTQRDPLGRVAATFETEEDDAAGVPGDPTKGLLPQNVLPKKKRPKPGNASEAGGESDDGLIQDYQPQRIEFHDAIEFDDKARVHITQDGYLAAEPRIARVGVQLYRGTECGCDDLDVVRVYRPYDSVFAADSIRSLAHRPVTIEHPTERVTKDNWKKYAVGHTGDTVSRDQDGKITSVRVPMVLMDAAAVQAFRDGKNQLSVGYTCDLDWEAGVTEDGDEYDAVQRNIRANHLAVVAMARGGPTLRIGDDSIVHKEASMDLKTIMVDGIACPMSDTAAQVVQRTLQKLKDEYDAFKKKKAEEEEEDEEESSSDKASIVDLKKKLDARDGEIAALKQQLKDALDPARQDAQLKQRMIVGDQARRVLGDRVKIDGKSIEDIRRQVVDSQLGTIAKDWSDEKVEGAFTHIVGQAKGGAGNGYSDAVRAFSTPQPHYDSDPREAAWREMLADQANAWRGERKTA